MNEGQGGLPNYDGVVPIVFDGVSLLFSWIKSCDIWIVSAKMKLRELIGPLAVLIFYGKSGEGEIGKDVCLKVIGKRWTISVVLFHWPTGSAVPKMLLLPFDGMEREVMCGEGGKVVWGDGSQTIKQFAVTRTTRRDLYLWTHSLRLNESCGSMGFSATEEADGGEIAEWERDAGESEGDLRAAQAARERGVMGAEDGGLKAEAGAGLKTEDGGPKTEAGAGVKTEDGGLKAEAGAGLKTEDGGPKTEDGAGQKKVGVEPGTEASGDSLKIRVIQKGSALEYGGKTYYFGGYVRWEYVMKLIASNGEYTELGKGVKSYFAKSKQAEAFYDAAIEPEGQGIKGTGRYRLKI